jgi:hypothetical protein
MGEGQNVPESTGGFLHPQNCNFPEESFILSSPCNSVEWEGGVGRAISYDHEKARSAIKSFNTI